MEGVHVRLSATTSLLHNNLTGTLAGRLCTVHNSVNAGAGKLMLHDITNGVSRDGPSAERVTSVRFLDFPFGCVLCVSSTSGTQIYKDDASALLFFAPVTPDAQAGNVMEHHQGACVVTPLQHIAIGTSKGSLILVHVASAEQFTALPECSPGSAACEIADLCFNEVANAVVSAHKNGELRVWGLTGPPYTNTGVQQGSESPVRIASLGARLLVAYGLGTICLYDAISVTIQVEVTAHARWITAVTVQEETGRFASVGEDTVLNVWHADPASGKVNLLHTSVVADKLLTGVVFNGSGASVVAYDTDEIYHVTF